MRTGLVVRSAVLTAMLFAGTAATSAAQTGSEAAPPQTQKPPAQKPPPQQPPAKPDEFDDMADQLLKKLNEYARKKKVAPKQQTKADAGKTSIVGVAIAFDVPVKQFSGGTTADRTGLARFGDGGTAPMLSLAGSFDVNDFEFFSTMGFFGGPVLYFPMRQRFLPFVEALVGVERCCGGEGSTSDFGFQFGGGADIDINRSFMIRAGIGVRRVFFEGGSAGSFIIQVGLSIPIGQ